MDAGAHRNPAGGRGVCALTLAAAATSGPDDEDAESHVTDPQIRPDATEELTAALRERILVMHNGSLSASGVRTTGGRSGSFEVRRSTVNSRGTDSFVFRARNTRSGELCVGTVNH